MRTSMVLAILSLLLLVSPIEAQEPAPGQEAARALARLAPGTTIRVQTRGGEVLEGAFRLAGDDLFLETDAGGRVVGLGDVRSAWAQERRTRPGALTGGLIGAGATGAYMGLFALIAGATGSEAATMIAIGVLGGAAGGGLLGGIVGAALPRWTLAYAARPGDEAGAPAVPTRTDVRTERRRLGSFEAAPGHGRIGGDEPTDGGWGGRVALNAEFGTDPATATGTSTFFTIGPEVGWFDLGSTELLRRDFLSGDTLEFSRHITSFTAGGVARGGLAWRVVRTYGILGLAFHQWQIDQRDERWINPSPDPPVFGTGDSSFEHLGYTIGAGAQATLAPRTALGIELRRTAVGTFDMDLPGSYWSLTASLARRW